MEDGLQSTLDFEFGIVGDQLDLSDDEDLLWQVSVQASKVELQRQQEANFTAWREDLADQFQHFLTELVGELQPRQDDYLARLNIVGRLSSVLDDMGSFRGATLSTFGSFESNFYTRWSDLDLSLELPDRNEPIGKKLKMRVLNSLMKTLMRKGEAHNVQFIPHARVPLITFEDSRHNISCDISVDNDAAMLKSRFLRWIGEIDSRCRDLVFLVKCWAKAHSINDPKMGTLNSFALCLLVIFHLQTRSPPVLPPLSAVLDEDIARQLKGSENFIEEALRRGWEKIQPFVVNQFGAQNKSSVAELFITFFNQFSAVKDFWNQGLAVCTFRGAWGDRSSTCAKWRTKRYIMAIEDPFDRWENCARSVQESTFGSIIRAFTSTADTLQRPVPNVGMSGLLEALFLWPVDAQALGREAWLAKVHSKAGKRKLPPWNTSIMNTASRKVRSKAQQSRYHRPNNIEISLDTLLEKSLEAQFRGRLQLDESGTPVKQRKKRKKKPKDFAVVGVGIPGTNLAQNSLHLERIDNRAQAIENHLHQLLNIPRDSVVESSVEALVKEQSLVNHCVIAGVSKEMKKKKRGGIPAVSPVSGLGAGNNLVPENNTQSNLLYERTGKEDKKAEHNPHHLQTEKNLCIEGVARTQKPTVLKDPQKGNWPALEHEPKSISLSVSYSNNEAQLQGDPWPAIQSSTRDHPGRFLTDSPVTQVQNPLTEKKSYASAMKNGDRQRSRFNQGGSTLVNGSTGILPRNNNGMPGKTVPAAKWVDIPGRATRPAAWFKSNHNMRQGEAKFQTAQHPHVAKVWAPRNMAEKYAKFSSVIEGQKNTTVAVGGSSICKSEPLSHYDKATG